MSWSLGTVSFVVRAAAVFVLLPKSSAFCPRFARSSRLTPVISKVKVWLADAATSVTVERDECVKELMEACREAGQVGSLASQEQRDKVENLAKKLVPMSDPEPARQPLTGIHNLVYSAAEGGSSGRLAGPIYGAVTQEFVNDETFINGVTLGPLSASLRASRKVMNDKDINVKFLETTVKLFGQTVIQKEISGGGMWKYLFIGEVQDENGNSKLVRVMETPSLFVLEQPL